MTLNRGDVETLEAFLADAGAGDGMVPGELEALQRVVEHCRGAIAAADQFHTALDRAANRQPIIQRDPDPIVVALGKIGKSLDRMEQHMRSRR